MRLDTAVVVFFVPAAGLVLAMVVAATYLLVRGGSPGDYAVEARSQRENDDEFPLL